MHSLLDFLSNLSLSPELVQCPGSKAHVWDIDQCPRIGGGGPGSFPGSGGGGGGLLGLIGDLLGGIL